MAIAFVFPEPQGLLNELNQMAKERAETLASMDTRRPRAGYQPTPGPLICVDRPVREKGLSVIRLLSDSGWIQKPESGYEANIPHSLTAQTRLVSAWAGTLQLSVFLALLVLPLVLITEVRQTPEGAMVLALVCAAARRSHLRYLRVQVR